MEGLIKEIARYREEIEEMEFQDNKNLLVRRALRQQLAILEKQAKELKEILN